MEPSGLAFGKPKGELSEIRGSPATRMDFRIVFYSVSGYLVDVP